MARWSNSGVGGKASITTKIKPKKTTRSMQPASCNKQDLERIVITTTPKKNHARKDAELFYRTAVGSNIVTMPTET
jgi:hypothetical protein